MASTRFGDNGVPIEHMLFDGALTPVKGALWPDLSRPGMGIAFKRVDAEKYQVSF
jgi:hypothetical protein